MIVLSIGFFFLTVLVFTDCTNRALENLPHWRDAPGGEHFLAKPYIEVAISLQAMGRERACERLMSIAKDDRDADQVIFCVGWCLQSAEPTSFVSRGLAFHCILQEPIILAGRLNRSR